MPSTIGVADAATRSFATRTGPPYPRSSMHSTARYQPGKGTLGNVIVIGHLSDIHIDGSERSMQRARRVTRYLAGLPVPVDVVLATGDLADHGAAAEYEGVRDVLDIPVP